MPENLLRSDYLEIRAGRESMETRVAVISIIVENPEATEQLNQYLHESGKYIIGRNGNPVPSKRNPYYQYCD